MDKPSALTIAPASVNVLNIPSTRSRQNSTTKSTKVALQKAVQSVEDDVKCTPKTNRLQGSMDECGKQVQLEQATKRATRGSKSRPPSPTAKSSPEKTVSRCKSRAEESPKKVANLEQEISQRKVASGKGTSSLDKLLNKKQQQMNHSAQATPPPISPTPPASETRIVKDQCDLKPDEVSIQQINLGADAQPEPDLDPESAAEAGELPMDIDEELTTAPTRTQLSASASKLADIIDDERPPAAPLPASPTPTPTSNDEMSDAGSDLSERRRMRCPNAYSKQAPICRRYPSLSQVELCSLIGSSTASG